MEPAKGIRWAMVGLAAFVAVGCTTNVYVTAVEPEPTPYDCYAREVDNHVAVIEHGGSYDGLWDVWHANGCDYAPDGTAGAEAMERVYDGRE